MDSDINDIKVHLTNAAKFTGDKTQKKWEISELLEYMKI